MLVQNTKDISAAEHSNPMALVTVHSGQLNETTVAQGFSKMFDWGWTWRAKFQSPKTFLMRFPNKAKLVELKNFEKFTLLGIGAIVEVDFWSPDDKAKGKLHSVWIKMLGVPETLRHYFRICEIGSALGPVVEVDVEHIHSKEEIRLKVGVRDLHKIPAGTEITTKDLLLYDIGFEFESIAEQGWYKFDDGNKRKVFDFLSLDGVPEQRENDVQKKNKKFDTIKHTVSFGSMGLKQYEQVVTGEGQSKLLLGSCSNNQEIGVAVNRKEEQNLLMRLQLAEEMVATQAAQLMTGEKRRKEIEIIKTILERGEKTT